jgi:uncharacterized protein
MIGLHLDENKAIFQIRSFRPGQIQVNDKILLNSIIIMPEQLIENWQPQTFVELTADTLTPILAFNPDILLIGTGERLQFPSPDVYGDLINHGIGVEIMDTGAASRTFNALVAENRKVVGALIIR